MGTAVINKLRIQGTSASLGDPSLKQAGQRVNFDGCDTPKRFAFHQATNNIGKVRKFNSPNVSHPNSAPSRKQNFLQRVQVANRGLTSCAFPSYPSDYVSDKNTVHFLLQGKPANGDLEILPPSPTPHKRVGHYKTSTKEQYRSRHRFRDMSDFYADSSVPLNNVAFGDNEDFFYLGPDASSVPKTLRANKKSHMVFLPHSAPNRTKEQNWNKITERENSSEDKPSSGCDIKSIKSDGTFILPDYDNESKREKADSEYHEYKPTLHPTPVPIKKKNTTSRSSITDQSSVRPSDSTLLNQCLHVQQPSNAMESQTAEELYRHNKGFRGKSPTKHLKSLNGNTKSLGFKDIDNNKYLFNSVESYVHFNKIYPQVESSQSSSFTAKGISSKIRSSTNFPRMEGFSPHCTDTLLLKMMFEMNKPTRSVKSVSKYSDVAVHKDLEEFMVVGTPSLSRSASVNSSGLGLGSLKKSREKISES